ncbi:MAG: hypothetical protein WC147_06295 [Syntrophomonas sp.]
MSKKNPPIRTYQCLTPTYHNYLMHLFEQLPNVDAKDPTVIDNLLPWSAVLPDDCRMPNKENTSNNS